MVNKHGVELADAVNAVETLTDQVWNIILSIKMYYNTKCRLKKLRTRTKFLSAFQDSGGISFSRQRKIANNWRCIRFAIENEVPIDKFVLTNVGRMETKMTESRTDSEDVESESSTFDDVIDNPITTLPDITIHYSIDASAPETVVLEGEEAEAHAASTAPAQAPNPKKTKKRKRKGQSSGRPVESKFLRV